MDGDISLFVSFFLSPLHFLQLPLSYSLPISIYSHSLCVCMSAYSAISIWARRKKNINGVLAKKRKNWTWIQVCVAAFSFLFNYPSRSSSATPKQNQALYQCGVKVTHSIAHSSLSLSLTDCLIFFVSRLYLFLVNNFLWAKKS